MSRFDITTVHRYTWLGAKRLGDGVAMGSSIGVLTDARLWSGVFLNISSSSILRLRCSESVDYKRRYGSLESRGLSEQFSSKL